MKLLIKSKLLFMICLCCWMSLLYKNAAAQQAQLKYLHDLAGMNAQKMRYDYKVYMINKHSAAILDSVSGVMYRDRMYYLDSNALVINMRDADYTLQLNPPAKTAYVKSVKAILAKMKGKEPENYSLFDIADLQKRKIISFQADKNQQGNTHLKIVFDEPDIDEIDAELTPEHTLTSFVLKIPAGGVGNEAQQRVLMMYHFTDQFSSSVIATSRFMTANKETCILKGMFAAYKLQRLI